MSAGEHSQQSIRIAKRSPHAEFFGQLPEEDAPEAIFKRLFSDFREYLKPDPFDPSRIEMKIPMGHSGLDRILVTATQLRLSIPKNRPEHLMGVSISDFFTFSNNAIDAAKLVEFQKLWIYSLIKRLKNKY